MNTTVRRSFQKLRLTILAVGAVWSGGCTRDPQPPRETEQRIEIAPGAASEVQARPADAEYFWWDTAPAVQAEIVFDDGSMMTAGVEETFTKRIVQVRFVNPTKQAQTVILRAQFE